MDNTDIQKQVEMLCGRTKKLEKGWYHFIYHHIHYVYILNSKNGMIRFSIPHLVKDSDYSSKRLAQIINETNREVKYVKVMILKNGSISIDYDHKICRGEKACEIVPHMINTLDCASEYFMHKLLTKTAES